MKELITKQPELKLVAPDVERDAPFAVGWLEGEAGRETLRFMGNTDINNKPSTLEEERLRIKKFIDADDQKTWMMILNGRTVGVVWVVLEPTEFVQAPAVHIMIGEPTARSKGLGTAALTAVTGHLREGGSQELYSRHLADNIPAAKLLRDIGFVKLGKPYSDRDGLVWQNMIHKSL